MVSACGVVTKGELAATHRRAGPSPGNEGALERRRQPLQGSNPPQPPPSLLAADLMSGPGAPVSKALLWCGWKV